MIQGTIREFIGFGNNGYIYTGSVAPSGLHNFIKSSTGPTLFSNLQSGLYWANHRSLASDGTGINADTFTFNLGLPIQNSIAENYFHVLPMVPGWIGSGSPPSKGNGLVRYRSGQAVYDSDTGCTWAFEANLAATPSDRFSALQCLGLACTTTIKGHYVPLISASGTMLWRTATEKTNGFLAAMNGTGAYAGSQDGGYAGSQNWTLPEYGAKPTAKESKVCMASPWPCQCSNLQTLFEHLQQQADLVVGDTRLSRINTTFGGFQDLQPFFYWSCMADQNDTSPQPQCSADPAGYSSACVSLWSSFYFDTGFEGSAEASKQFNVMVYWPDSPSAPPPDGSMK
jgi:hypothetical protein